VLAGGIIDPRELATLLIRSFATTIAAAGIAVLLAADRRERAAGRAWTQVASPGAPWMLTLPWPFPMTYSCTGFLDE
jgi:hypothetical protein